MTIEDGSISNDGSRSTFKYMEIGYAEGIQLAPRKLRLWELVQLPVISELMKQNGFLKKLVAN